MSDEEEYYEEEEEVEEEEVEEAAEEEKEEEAEPVEEDLNEAEKAMLAAKQRHDADDEDKLQDYEDRRNEERSKEDEEIRKLKEKQEKRRLEREKEEREMAERKRLDEERRKAEEDERRAKQEEEKRRKEEEKKKKQAQLMGTFAQPGEGGRNFVLPQKSQAQGDKFGNIVQAKQEMGMTKEQQEETKRAFLAKVKETIQALSEIASSELKNKIKEVHQRICKLEADKYDLEKRHERQEYDLRELNERQRQVARNNALKAGVDPNEAGGRHPPKVQVFSKYDRQIDRRNFKERRAVYDTTTAYPVFPGLPPPPTVYDKVIAKYAHEIQEEQDAAYSKQYEVEDEEEEEE